MDRLEKVHPSDAEIERYCMKTVKDKRELAALEIHLFGCLLCAKLAKQTETLLDAVRAGLNMSDGPFSSSPVPPPTAARVVYQGTEQPPMTIPRSIRGS
jgi:hypothetical protein